MADASCVPCNAVSLTAILSTQALAIGVRESAPAATNAWRSRMGFTRSTSTIIGGRRRGWGAKIADRRRVTINQILRKIPIVVVDNDLSELSRNIVQTLDAS